MVRPRTLRCIGVVCTLVLAAVSLLILIIPRNKQLPVTSAAEAQSVRPAYMRSLAPLERAVAGAEVASAGSLGLTLARKARRELEALALLKRWRPLALSDASARPDYLAGTERLLARFPYSDGLVALYLEVALEERARNHAVTLRRIDLESVALSALVRSGAFSTVEEAGLFLADGLDAGAWLERLSGFMVAEDAEAVLVDAQIARIAAGDIALAVSRSRVFLESFSISDVRARRFFAALEYDYGDFAFAADWMEGLDDVEDTLLAGSARWLSGAAPRARELWAQVDERVSAVALYNLARTADDAEQMRALSARLAAVQSGFAPGLVLYSRYLDDAGARTLLLDADRISSPLPELEWIRRSLADGDVQRALSRLWLLLSRHPKDEILPRWAAWFMRDYKLDAELELLLAQLEKTASDPDWLYAYQGLEAAQDGNIPLAESCFERASASDADWRIVANQALAALSGRRTAEALERFVLAVGRCENAREKSRLQVRIAACLEALGRPGDARRALEYALDLDPANSRARMELKKLGTR